MYVCICRAVTESEVHASITAGARTVRQIRDTTGAGGDCARCVRKICAMLKRSEESLPAVQIGVSPPCRVTGRSSHFSTSSSLPS